MATYVELFDLRANNDLRNRIAVACAVKAQTLLALASPSAAQVAWARTALADPSIVAGSLMNYVLAANKSATVAQITSATDAAIQTHVDAAADKIISGS